MTKFKTYFGFKSLGNYNVVGFKSLGNEIWMKRNTNSNKQKSQKEKGTSASFYIMPPYLYQYYVSTFFNIEQYSEAMSLLIN